MTEEFESQEYAPRRWPRATVSMALRALNKLWYPLEDEYFYDRSLPSKILDTIELPLLLLDPDEIEDYGVIEKLSAFIGVIEGVETQEDLYDFMREQQEMLLKAREAHAERMGMGIQEASEYRAKMRGIINDAPYKFTLGGEEGQPEEQKD